MGYGDRADDPEHSQKSGFTKRLLDVNFLKGKVNSEKYRQIVSNTTLLETLVKKKVFRTTVTN